MHIWDISTGMCVGYSTQGELLGLSFVYQLKLKKNYKKNYKGCWVSSITVKYYGPG